jgi:hypothetical protein
MFPLVSFSVNKGQNRGAHVIINQTTNCLIKLNYTACQDREKVKAGMV